MVEKKNMKLFLVFRLYLKHKSTIKPITNQSGCYLNKGEKVRVHLKHFKEFLFKESVMIKILINMNQDRVHQVIQH